jgi:hypothetical protein
MKAPWHEHSRGVFMFGLTHSAHQVRESVGAIIMEDISELRYESAASTAALACRFSAALSQLLQSNANCGRCPARQICQLGRSVFQMRGLRHLRERYRGARRVARVPARLALARNDGAKWALHAAGMIYLRHSIASLRRCKS